MSAPFHQCRSPRPLAKMCEGVSVAARVATARIAQYSQKRGHGCYLFVDDGGAVYVVGETSSAAHRWAVEHADWWLGCWDARASRWHSCCLEDAIRAELEAWRPLTPQGDRALSSL